MAVKIRLTRKGGKKRPYYHIVLANAQSPRDGRFLEKIGTYAPLLSKDHENRVTIKADRLAYWLSVGAVATDKVKKLIEIQIRKNDKTITDKTITDKTTRKSVKNKLNKLSDSSQTVNNQLDSNQ